MRMDSQSFPQGVKVVDDATGTTLHDVVWVDDVSLEYAVVSQPVRYDLGTWEIATDVVKVTRVQIDWVSKVIHLNDLPAPAAAIAVRELHACDQCCQEETCRRIHYCAAYRCGFGEVAKP
jgi:hypothetical protein